MWTHRRFTWHYRCPDAGKLTALEEQVRLVLQGALDDTPQFYRDAQITGAALGVLEFNVTISDRDQWWVARRARMLATELRNQTDLPLDLIDEVKVKLVPHSNRGKYRLRRLRRNTDA